MVSDPLVLIHVWLGLSEVVEGLKMSAATAW